MALLVRWLVLVAMASTGTQVRVWTTDISSSASLCAATTDLDTAQTTEVPSPGTPVWALPATQVDLSPAWSHTEPHGVSLSTHWTCRVTFSGTLARAPPASRARDCSMFLG